jgi:hypothetical protein
MQVEHWKGRAELLQQQLGELEAAHALQAQERLQEQEMMSRDRAADADVMSDAAFRQQQMTIRSQQKVKVLQKSSASTHKASAPDAPPPPPPPPPPYPPSPISLNQRIRELSEDKARLEDNILALAERYQAPPPLLKHAACQLHPLRPSPPALCRRFNPSRLLPRVTVPL